MAIGSMLRPRWLPEKSFPPYAYLPGRQPHPVRDPAGHSYRVEPIPVAAEASLGSDVFLWGLDLFNHGYYWEAHEAWEGLWQVVDRGGPSRMLFKGLILLSAAGVKIREGKHAAAVRHAGRAAALLRRLMKAPELAFDAHSACRPRRSLNTPKRPPRLMLIYRRRRLDSLNPCSISFSDQIPTEGRADKGRGAFCDGCDRPGLVGISRRDRGPIALGLYVRPCWEAKHADTPFAACVGGLRCQRNETRFAANFDGADVLSGDQDATIYHLEGRAASVRSSREHVGDEGQGARHARLRPW